MINLPVEVDGYKFSTLDNPRKSDYILGDIKCSICGCQTSVYVKVEHAAASPGNGWNDLTICGTCIEAFSWALKKRTLETFRESADRRTN